MEDWHCQLSHPFYLLNYVKRLMVQVRTADVTYYADVTIFLYAMSGELSPITTFSLCRFLAFYWFKIYLSSLSRSATSLYFCPILWPLNMKNKLT